MLRLVWPAKPRESTPITDIMSDGGVIWKRQMDQSPIWKRSGGDWWRQQRRAGEGLQPLATNVKCKGGAGRAATGPSEAGIAKHRRKIPCSMEHPRNVDAARGDAVKNHIVPNGKTEQSRQNISPVPPHMRIIRDKTACSVDNAQKIIGRIDVIRQDIKPNIL